MLNIFSLISSSSSSFFPSSSSACLFSYSFIHIITHSDSIHSHLLSIISYISLILLSYLMLCYIILVCLYSPLFYFLSITLHSHYSMFVRFSLTISYSSLEGSFSLLLTSLSLLSSILSFFHWIINRKFAFFHLFILLYSISIILSLSISLSRSLYIFYRYTFPSDTHSSILFSYTGGFSLSLLSSFHLISYSHLQPLLIPIIHSLLFSSSSEDSCFFSSFLFLSISLSFISSKRSDSDCMIWIVCSLCSLLSSCGGGVNGNDDQPDDL